MQHTAAMRGLERAREANPGIEDLFERERGAAAHARAHRVRAVLHRDVRPAIGGDTRLIDRDDRRVHAEARHHVGLGLELASGGIGVAHTVQHLHRDYPVWHVLLIEEYLGKTAGA